MCKISYYIKNSYFRQNKINTDDFLKNYISEYYK